MTANLLTWLLLPPLAMLGLIPAAERGRVVGRLVVFAFAIGTLWVGVGDLHPESLRAYAAASPGAALFVSLSAGLLLGGLMPWPPAAWRSWVAGLPLVVAAVVIVWPSLRVGPYLLGATLGALPLLLASVVPAHAVRAATPPDAATGAARAGWLVLLVTLGLALAGTLVAVLLAPLAALVIGIAVSRNLPRGRSQVVLPAVATLAALGLGWLALTIAGDALAEVASFFTSAPVSPAAERWLALLAVILVLAMLAPWPLGRFGLGVTLAPAAATLAYRLSLSVAPEAIGDWLPVLGMLLVPAAVLAALRGRWPEALAIAAVLAAWRPGALTVVGAGASLVAALILAGTTGARNLLSPGRVTFAGAWWLAALTALGCAAATVTVLAHEVVLATLLAGGLACAAARVRPAGS